MELQPAWPPGARHRTASATLLTRLTELTAVTVVAVCLALGVAITGCADLSSIYEVEGRFPCTSDDDCLDGFACGSAPYDPQDRVCQPVCESHADCVRDDGAPAVCARGACLAVDTNLCTTIEGPLGEPNTIVIGAMTPQQNYGDRELASVLAVRDFNDAGGISQGRRLVLIGCDDGGDPELAEQVGGHLAALGVPAVIGPYFSGVFIETVTQVFRDADVLAISPSATSPVITNIEDDGLAWRTISSDTQQSQALAELVLQRSPTYVLMYGKGDAYGESLLGAIGATLLSELGSEAVRPTTYDDTEPDIPALIDLAFDSSFPQPDVVVLAGTSEVVDIIAAYEDEVQRRGSDPPRYIVSEGGKITALLDMVAANPNLAGRIEGTDPSVQNGDIFAKFAASYQASFGIPPATFAPNAYDAVYVVAHALSTTSEPFPTGQDVAAGIPMLVGGAQTVPVDRDQVGQATALLAQGEGIDLEGTSGELDFDLETGNTGGSVTSWTVEPGPLGPYVFVTTGVFSPETATWNFESRP